MEFARHIAFAGAVCAAILFGPAAASAHEIKFGALVIHHPWSRAAGPGEASGFMTITNTGKTDDRLVKATAEIAATVHIADTRTVAGDTSPVELAEGLLIPAGATVKLKPGALHIAFRGVTVQPEEGEVFDGMLSFEKAGTVAIDYEVVAP